jgi:hypothetical protein
MFTVLAAIAALVFLTVLMHMEGLWLIEKWTDGLQLSARIRLALIVGQTFVLHLLEIGCYGTMFLFADRYMSVGSLESTHAIGAIDYLFFSAETFTAVGYGDMIVTGDLRLLASVEPLNGLTLISWSGAFTFLAMQRYWNGRTG